MSKVVKILATVAAVALAIPTGGGSLLAVSLGVSALAATGIVAGLTIGASLLAKRPKAPEIPRENIDRLNASIDPRTPRKAVLGTTAMNCDIRDQEYSDDQTYLHRFIVVAAHRVQAIDAIWFDDQLAWTSSGGVQGEYSGYLTVTTRTEGTAGNAINISARMGSARRYTGCAYVYLRYKLTGNSKKTDSPFAQGIPTRITIIGDGAFAYDPRKDSTVAGGSGSHRADDQATWEWDDDASRNPALQLLWALLGWRINGKVSIGYGIPPERIDLESFAVAANLCDETVSLAAGGTEPRYRSDGVFGDSASPSTVIDNLKAVMNADLDDAGGQLRLTVFHNDLADPVAHFTEDDMIEGFDWDQTPSLDETFNVVRGAFTDAAANSLYQMVDYPEVAIDSADGIERADIFNLPFVQSPSQAQRLAKQRLQRQQYGGTFATTFNARGWKCDKNDVVTLDFAPLGWTEKLFRVAEIDHRVDGTVPMLLREEAAQIYAWDEEESPPVEPVAPTVYNFNLTPVSQALADTAGGIVGVADVTIKADYLGEPTTALPKTQPYAFMVNGVDRTSEANWSVAVISGTIAASIGASDGVLSLDEDSGELTSAVVRISAERSGVTNTMDVRVNKTNAAAPAGGGTASGNVIGSTISDTMVPVGDELTITVGASGEVQLAAGYTFDTASPGGSYSEYAQWYDVTGSPTPIGTEVEATTPYIAVTGDPGTGQCNFNHTGLTPSAVQKYRLYMRNSSGSVARNINGTCSAVTS